jgi:hypothetical protein
MSSCRPGESDEIAGGRLVGKEQSARRRIALGARP